MLGWLIKSKKENSNVSNSFDEPDEPQDFEGLVNELTNIASSSIQKKFDDFKNIYDCYFDIFKLSNSVLKVYDLVESNNKKDSNNIDSPDFLTKVQIMYSIVNRIKMHLDILIEDKVSIDLENKSNKSYTHLIKHYNLISKMLIENKNVNLINKHPKSLHDSSFNNSNKLYITNAKKFLDNI